MADSSEKLSQDTSLSRQDTGFAENSVPPGTPEELDAERRAQVKGVKDGSFSKARPENDVFKKASKEKWQAARGRSAESTQREIRIQNQVNKDLRSGLRRDRESRPDSFLDWLLARLAAVLPSRELDSLRKEISRKLMTDGKDALVETIHLSYEMNQTDRPQESPKSSAVSGPCLSPETLNTSPIAYEREPEALLAKLQSVMRDYLASGTDYSLAGGRVWGAHPSRVEYTPFLFHSYEELTLLYPRLMADAHFRRGLEALRSSLRQEKIYQELKEAEAAQARELQAFAAKGFEVSIQGASVLVTLGRDMTLREIVAELCEEPERWRYLNIYEQLALADATVKDLIKPARELGNPALYGQQKLPAGSTLQVAGTVLLQSAYWRLLERRLEICDLLLECSAHGTSGAVRLSFEAQGQVRRLRELLCENIARLRGIACGPGVLPELFVVNLAGAEKASLLKLFNVLGSSPLEEEKAAVFIMRLAAEANKIGAELSRVQKATEETRTASLGAHEVSALELAGKYKNKLREFDIRHARLQRFSEIMQAARQEIGDLQTLSSESRERLYREIQAVAQETMLKELEAALTAIKGFECSADGHFRPQWDSLERGQAGIRFTNYFGDLQPFFTSSVEELSMTYGEWAADLEFTLRLMPLRRRYRERSLACGLGRYAHDSDQIVARLEKQGLSLLKESALAEPMVRLTQRSALSELTRKVFELAPDTTPSELHYALILQGNPDLAEIFERAAYEGVDQVTIQEGALISLQTVPLGLELQERLLRELCFEHELIILRSVHAAPDGRPEDKLTPGAFQHAVARKNSLELAAKRAGLQRQVASYLAAVAGRQSRIEDLARNLIVFGSIPWSVEEDLARPFDDLRRRHLRQLEEEPDLKEMAFELRVQTTLAEMQAVFRFGLQLLSDGRGNEAGQAFGRALKVSEYLVEEQSPLGLDEKKKIFELRAVAYQRLAESCLFDSELRRVAEKTANGAAKAGLSENERQYVKKIESRIVEAGFNARLELDRLHKLVPGQSLDYATISQALKEQQFVYMLETQRMMADLYGLLNDPQARHHWLEAEAVGLLGLPAAEVGIFSVPDADVRIKEDDGTIVTDGRWLSTDNYRALSAERLGKLRQYYVALTPERRRRLLELIPLMVGAALEFKDVETGLQAALCERQVMQLLLKEPQSDPSYGLLCEVLDAQVRYAYGVVEDRKGAKLSALGVLHRAKQSLAKLSAPQSAEGSSGLVCKLAGTESPEEKEALFNQVMEERRAAGFRRLIADQIFSEQLRLRMQLAQSEKSLAQAEEVSCMRREFAAQGALRLVELETELARAEETASRERRENKASSWASEARVLTLRREILSQKQAEAELMLEEALTYLYAGYGDKAKQVLESLKEQYDRKLDWVDPTVVSILQDNNKGSMIAAVQAALNELAAPTFGMVGDTATILGAGVTGAGVGFLLGNAPGAALGFLGASGAALLGLKGVNTVRGWGHISSAYSSGLTSLSGVETAFDCLLVAVDALSVVSVLKGSAAGRSALRAVGREALETKAKVLVRESPALTLEAAKKQVARRIYSAAAAQETGRFGGRWAAYLTAGAVLGPGAYQAGRIGLDDSMTVEEKLQAYEHLGAETGRAVLLTASFYVTHYALNRFVNRLSPAELVVRLRNELESCRSRVSGGAREGTQVTEASPLKAGEPAGQAGAGTAAAAGVGKPSGGALKDLTQIKLEQAGVPEQNRMRDAVREKLSKIGALLREEMDNGRRRLLEAQRAELAELVSETAKVSESGGLTSPAPGKRSLSQGEGALESIAQPISRPEWFDVDKLNASAKQAVQELMEQARELKERLSQTVNPVHRGLIQESIGHINVKIKSLLDKGWEDYRATRRMPPAKMEEKPFRAGGDEESARISFDSDDVWSGGDYEPLSRGEPKGLPYHGGRGYDFGAGRPGKGGGLAVLSKPESGVKTRAVLKEEATCLAPKMLNQTPEDEGVLRPKTLHLEDRGGPMEFKPETEPAPVKPRTAAEAAPETGIRPVFGENQLSQGATHTLRKPGRIGLRPASAEAGVLQIKRAPLETSAETPPVVDGAAVSEQVSGKAPASLMPGLAPEEVPAAAGKELSAPKPAAKVGPKEASLEFKAGPGFTVIHPESAQAPVNAPVELPSEEVMPRAGLAFKIDSQAEPVLEPQAKSTAAQKAQKKRSRLDDDFWPWAADSPEEKKKPAEEELSVKKRELQPAEHEESHGKAGWRRAISRRYLRRRKKPEVGAEEWQRSVEKHSGDQYQYEIDDKEYTK